MNSPLAYADMSTEGEEDIFGLFEFIGSNEAKGDMVSDPSEEDLKTTSVRLKEKQLKAFDAVVKQFGLTRNEAFAYAISQFMADAIAGYAVGRANAISYDNFEQGACDERTDFIASLPLDDEMKDYVSTLTLNDFLKRLGVE